MECGNLTTATLPAIAADLEDLRAIERLLGRTDQCRVRRFDETYQSLDDLLASHAAPLSHLEFESTGVKVRVSRERVLILHDGASTPIVRELESCLRHLALPPLIRWLNVLRLMLGVSLFLAAYEGAYATLMIAMVAWALLEQAAFDVLRQKAAVKLPSEFTRDPRFAIALVVLAMFVARLVQQMGGN